MISLAVLGSTKGTDLQTIIDAIESGELDAKIEIVISDKNDAHILERARKHNILAVYIEKFKQESRKDYDKKILNEMYNKKIDLILLIGWMRILSPTFVRNYHKKILNVHPSLLPKFSGGMDTNVHEEILKAGETETGCTIHYVDEGVDTGEIILQKKCSVDLDETVESLKNKVQKLEGKAFVEVIKLFL
ncbi:MAG: phosphoribosylglycinamide formyltransferase [Candidatus Magasanikbacteria bacterium CG_4_10_14_0_2_um_filter_37_12]|uniref:Phosphoribosylglycinamide formyltransferase n=1 Tax=Candidatus Magasanikbacteria bacterium CG_4_10_14_0_2_um_filter_37_12 TaxID=1974637 RepID=A0A2M7V951_9BACT|nr:MAG: phosphoribosylglycinamide formyltransferase [Candidatus Magasanikbacteria bacterium CG_4_10_14_0_2_um_filter_37_12]